MDFGKNILDVNLWNFALCSIMYCFWTHHADSWILSAFRYRLPSFEKLSPSIYQLSPYLSSLYWIKKTSFGKLSPWAVHSPVLITASIILGVNLIQILYVPLLTLYIEICTHIDFTLFCISIFINWHNIVI